MLKNELIIISMTRQDLDDYIEKYHRSQEKRLEPEGEDKLSQKQTAALFGVTTATIIRWQKKGLIPVNKIGRTVFYDRAELLRIAQTGVLK